MYSLDSAAQQTYLLTTHKSLPNSLVAQAISSLVDGDGSIVQVNDKGLVAPLRVRLKFKNGSA